MADGNIQQSEDRSIEKSANEGAAEQRPLEAIQAEIEASQQELGDIVAELAEKADVKKQTKRKVEATKADLATKPDELAEGARQTARQIAAQASQVAQEDPIRAVAAAFAGGLGYRCGSKRRLER
jgi:ElaB/YqjD/DUF883 family membrane-anchored ribosome-binding protein